MITLALFHLGLGLVVGYAPERVVVDASSINALRVMPGDLPLADVRILWFLAFAACAGAIALLAWHFKLWAQLVTWGAVLWVDGVWLAAYAGPLRGGEGDAVGTIIFPALIAWSVFLLIRVAQNNGG